MVFSFTLFFAGASHRASTSPGYGTQPLSWHQTLASNLLYMLQKTALNALNAALQDPNALKAAADLKAAAAPGCIRTPTE